VVRDIRVWSVQLRRGPPQLGQTCTCCLWVQHWATQYGTRDRVGFINANAYNGGDAIGASHNGHVQFSDGLAGPAVGKITIKRNMCSAYHHGTQRDVLSISTVVICLDSRRGDRTVIHHRLGCDIGTF